MRTCKVDRCNKKHDAKGYCSAHYRRYKLYGDPLRLAPKCTRQQDFIDAALRAETDECILWPFGTAGHGYGAFREGGKRAVVSHMVLESSVGPRPSPNHCACHKPVACHNRLCINPRHLRWDTFSANAMDRLRDGTHNRGKDCPTVKLTEKQVHSIRLDTRSCADIARDHGIASDYVSLVRRGRRWRWLDTPGWDKNTSFRASANRRRVRDKKGRFV